MIVMDLPGISYAQMNMIHLSFAPFFGLERQIILLLTQKTATIILFYRSAVANVYNVVFNRVNGLSPGVIDTIVRVSVA